MKLLRCLHSTPRSFAKAKAPAIPSATPDAPISSQPTKREITENASAEWLAGGGAKYADLTPRNYLHNFRPFPRNPWFVPQVPVSDKIKTAIYDTYKRDPKYWSPRSLALKFKLSTVRVEAIVRLKHLEHIQSNQGYAMQRTLTSQMEMLLGADDVQKFLREPVDFGPQGYAANAPRNRLNHLSDKGDPSKSSAHLKSSSDIYSPRTATGRDVKLTPDSFERQSDGTHLIALSGVLELPSPKSVILESSNPRETNSRWTFLFADIGEGLLSPKRSTSGDVERDMWMIVRTGDSTLRTATEEERKKHFQLYSAAKKGKKKSLWSI